MAKKAGLSALAKARVGGEGETPPPPGGKGAVKVATLRLPEDSWKQLRILAAQRGVTMHSIIIGALNGVFREEGIPPIP